MSALEHCRTGSWLSCKDLMQQSLEQVVRLTERFHVANAKPFNFVSKGAKFLLPGHRRKPGCPLPSGLSTFSQTGTLGDLILRPLPALLKLSHGLAFGLYPS
jgi:hypothetical protein